MGKWKDRLSSPCMLFYKKKGKGYPGHLAMPSHRQRHRSCFCVSPWREQNSLGWRYRTSENELLHSCSLSCKSRCQFLESWAQQEETGHKAAWIQGRTNLVCLEFLLSLGFHISPSLPADNTSNTHISHQSLLFSFPPTFGQPFYWHIMCREFMYLRHKQCFDLYYIIIAF